MSANVAVLPLPQSLLDVLESRALKFIREDGKCLETWKGHSNDIYVLITLPNGRVLSGSKDKTIKCWEVDKKTGKATCIGICKSFCVNSA